MRLKLVFLGRLQDVAGAAEQVVEGEESLAGLLAALAPEFASDRIRIAVNGILVTDRAAAVLTDGDEVAFLPPVSGG